MGALTNSLRSGGSRQKIHNDQMMVKLPSAVKKIVENIGTETGTSASAVVRDALAEYLERRGYRS